MCVAKHQKINTERGNLDGTLLKINTEREQQITVIGQGYLAKFTVSKEGK